MNMDLINTKGIYSLDAGLVDCLQTLKASRNLGDSTQTTSGKVSSTIKKYAVSANRNPSEYKTEFISYFNQHKTEDSERNKRILEFLKELKPQEITNPKSWDINSQDKKYILSLNDSFLKSLSSSYYAIQNEQFQKGKISEVKDITVQDIESLERNLQHFNSATVNWNMSMVFRF